MNINLVRFIAGKFAKSGTRQRFLNFARLIAFLSVMLGSMALIISLSVLQGFESELMKNAVKFTSHLTLITFNRSPIDDYDSKISSLKAALPNIKSSSPIIEKEALIRAGKNVDGILIRSMKKEYDITGVSSSIIKGKFEFTSDSARELIVGNRLAERLKIAPGDEIVLYVLRNNTISDIPDPKIAKFRISGIYKSGMAQYDDILVYMPFNTAAEFCDLKPGQVNSIEFMLHNLERLQETAMKAEAMTGYPHFARSFYDLHKPMFAWIELQKEPIPIVLGLISIVAVLNIITTLLITVVEKTHSIGILRALGMNNKDILSIFISQGVTIGFAGALTGAFLGFTAYFLQTNFNIVSLQGEIYYLDSLPMAFNFWHYVVVLGLSFLLSFIATLIPAMAALNISPLKAIRFK